MTGWNRTFWLSLAIGWTGWLSAADPETAPPEQPVRDSPRPNLRTQTLGGVQFWGDIAYRHGWHIQKNIFTGHYRLLDANDVRHAWGTCEACEARLEQICEEQQLPPMKGTAVIILHGLGRSDKSAYRIKRHFDKAGYHAIAMNYPSLRASVQENAEYLCQVIDSLDSVEKIHLVGFSMGGIVIRQYLAEHHPEKLGRVVFIGSPHQGAELATLFKDWWAYKTFVGPAGQDLATAPHGLAPKLPCPKCEFGIIAGCRGIEDGYNPLIPGDDDGTVSLECTRLPGARDFLAVQAIHQMLLHTPQVFTAVQHFLEEGRFDPEVEPTPIPPIAADPESSAATASCP